MKESRSKTLAQGSFSYQSGSAWQMCITTSRPHEGTTGVWEKTGQEVLLRLVALGRERKWILSLESYHCPTWLRKTFVKQIYLVPLSFVEKQRKKKRLELKREKFSNCFNFQDSYSALGCITFGFFSNKKNLNSFYGSLEQNMEPKFFLIFLAVSLHCAGGQKVHI